MKDVSPSGPSRGEWNQGWRVAMYSTTLLIPKNRLRISLWMYLSINPGEAGGLCSTGNALDI
jgi:hypothetical protein